MLVHGGVEHTHVEFEGKQRRFNVIPYNFLIVIECTYLVVRKKRTLSLFTYDQQYFVVYTTFIVLDLSLHS